MNIALRLFAGIIDFVQFVFFVAFLAFQLMTPVGGGIAGAATGAGICYSASDNVISGVVAGVACAIPGGLIGAGISTLAIPIGIVIDIAISCTFGVLLVLMLFVTGRFSLMAVAFGFSAEMLPGINAFVPGWSLLVHRSIKAHKQKQALGAATGSSKLGSVLNVASMIPGVGKALSAAKPAISAVSMATRALPAIQQASNRIPLQTRNFDGIRAASDNHPRPYAQAA